MTIEEHYGMNMEKIGKLEKKLIYKYMRSFKEWYNNEYNHIWHQEIVYVEDMAGFDELAWCVRDIDFYHIWWDLRLYVGYDIREESMKM